MRMSFGNRFKKSLCVLFGWDENKVDDFEYKQEIDPVLGISRRLAMQKFASDFLRDMIHPDIHIRLTAMEMYDAICETQRCIIIDDIRQPNEAQFIKDMGGVVIRINRPGNPLPQSDHKVERQNPPHDYTIDNFGEPVDMLSQIAKQDLGASHAIKFRLLESIWNYRCSWSKVTVQK